MDDDFAKAMFSEGDRSMLGVQLFPARWLVNPEVILDEGSLAASTTRIVAVGVPVAGWEVMINRTAGVFLRRPPDLDDSIEAAAAFAAKTTQVLNSVVCELALAGTFFQPVSSLDVGRAVLHEQHAAVVSSSRPTISMQSAYGYPLDLLWQGRAPSMDLEEILQIRGARELYGIAAQLPQAVAAAYFWYNQRQNVEALLNAWIACEQLLDLWWKQYVSTFVNGKRRDRLNDARTYGSSVRIEILQSLGLLTPELADALHTARRARNELAHRAALTVHGATDAIMAMKATLEKALDKPVAAPNMRASLFLF